jgi:hypothetical protein
VAFAVEGEVGGEAALKLVDEGVADAFEKIFEGFAGIGEVILDEGGGVRELGLVQPLDELGGRDEVSLFGGLELLLEGAERVFIVLGFGGREQVAGDLAAPPALADVAQRGPGLAAVGGFL